MGIPPRKPSFSAQTRSRCPASLSLVSYLPFSLSRTPLSNGSTDARNSSGGSPPKELFHIHLCPIAQTERGTVEASVCPQSTAATMSQCSNALTNCERFSGLWRSQCKSFENPHSDEYVPPHHSMTSSFSSCAVLVMSAASCQERWSHQR